MKSRYFRFKKWEQISLCTSLLFSGLGFAGENSIDDPVLHPAIPILDEAGNHVLNSGGAYSSKMTCGTGGCHDYDKITHDCHFEMVVMKLPDIG